MFYEPKKKNHGLPKNPFNSLVIPRPIGWISSIDPEGNYNLAPYSFFNGVCYSPPTVMFSAGAGANSDNTKDSARNAENTGDFVCNMATWDTREQMNQSSATLPRDVDEIALTQLTPIKSKMVKQVKDETDTRKKNLFLDKEGKIFFEAVYNAQRKRIFNALRSSSSDSVIKFKEVLKKIIDGK